MAATKEDAQLVVQLAALGGQMADPRARGFIWGESFISDPKEFFDYCERQITAGGMDRKWFPDFVRVIDEFEYTQTEKILVRNLKKVHFDRTRLPAGTPLYWRRRGDDSFRPLDAAGYEELRREFAAREKLDLLDR